VLSVGLFLLRKIHADDEKTGPEPYMGLFCVNYRALFGADVRIGLICPLELFGSV